MLAIVRLVVHGTGGRPAESFLHRLGMPISDTTILRKLKRDMPKPSYEDDVRVLGIDVLEDRSVKSVKEWLLECPSIEVVSRDRCGIYSHAAREGAFQARQVVDRFHLVQNLRVVIKAQMSLYRHANIRPILSDDAIASTRDCFHRTRLAHSQSR